MPARRREAEILSRIMTTSTQQNPLGSFLSGSLFSAAGMVLGGVLALATGVIFAHWLGPGAFGIYSLALITLSVAAGVGTFGFDNGTARFAALYLGSGDTHRIRGLVRHGIVRVLIFSSLIALALFAVLNSGLLSRTRLAPLAHFSTWLLAGIPLYALQLTLFQAGLGLQGMKTRIVLEKLLQPVLRLVLPFALLIWLADPSSAAVGGLVASALLLVFASAVFLRARMRPLPAAAPVSPEEKKEWRRYATPFVFYSLQNFLWAGMGLDVFLVGILLSLHDAGVYAAALRLVPVLALARGAMDYSFGPRVGVLFGQSDFKVIGALYRKTSTMGLACTLPVAVILAVFGQPIMRILFGAGYEAGGTVLVILTAGFIVDSATGCNTTLLSMGGRSKLVLLNGLAGGAVLVSLAFLLIPHFGIAGAASATAASIIVTNLLATLEIWMLFRILPFGRTPAKLLAVGLGLVTFGLLWRSLVLPLIGSTGTAVAVSAGVVIVAYMALLLPAIGGLRAMYREIGGQV